MLTTERTIRICNSALLSIGQDVIEIEEKPKTLDQEITELKDDIDLLRKRVATLENEMKIVKDKLRQMSFTPGL